MKKVFLGILAVSLMAGCAPTSKEGNNTNVIFKEEFATVSKIESLKGRMLSDEILAEDVENTLKGILDLAIFESSSYEFGDVTQGIGSDGNGGRVFCSKLPVTIKFTGTEDSVEEFVEYFLELDNVISFGEFDVKEIGEDKYEVNTLINFLGKDASAELSGATENYTLQRNEGEVKREEEFSFRDFDISMMVRASNSDAASISLGVINDKDYRVHNDANAKKDVRVIFSNEGNSYFCEYSIGDGEFTKAPIKPKGDILFDILSWEVVMDDDNVAVDLHLINKSNKKVSVITYKDKNERIKVVEKDGNIEVKSK